LLALPSSNYIPCYIENDIMSDPHNMPRFGGGLPLDLNLAAASLTPTIPTTEFIRPCERIEPDSKEYEGMPTIALRYSALTHELPLAGAGAMHCLADGELAITAYLRAKAPWYEPVIDLLDEQWRLQLWLGRPWITFRPLLMIGRPGVGKSHLARMIAEKAGVGHASLSLAGVADSTTIEGTPRGFSTAMPSFPALIMSQHRTANPIALIEEIDKAGASARHGDPVAALMTMIEPGTARQFWDRCLLAPVDVSYVNWICTANTLEGLSPALRSRLDIVQVEGPQPEHFPILLGNLLHEIARQWGLSPWQLPDLAPEAEELLSLRFGKHRSVRRLDRELRAAMAAGISAAPRLRH
jgi:hypothetical protein